ncbi:kinase-like domain-containing protein [Suillus clintonianus]|uniref:kinase-like domain-containing protein n=1 Tax=Suillus clintonianus TaxID=1904413 RepID=UPI001B8725BC|nr:kinase-like domain-containing protein [Suillus clintonianus]KAG2157024.1 kinase-like domain-containing protein [Suillus clintonianus]
MSNFLELYEPLDIIGNGSFGIIRKVRRKSDGQILARKELNFERMSERDRKQIVAEVNILKDLHNEHIVRYHDRHVDRDAGILYILMEYCGGGDLSTVIKQAQKHNRPVPEDTIWNYFMQILLALHYCHHPGGNGRTGSGISEGDAKERRPQILHRDLKPDNVFLDQSNTVKLGDFGLSKALSQASFANTYVGTPYYMSPELMQERAYDSKSDIWSLGCLIYELCALKPPFHEAKTHAELSIFIRNGRIPPLPKGYSQALSSVIKAMLNLNPAMRPSAAQLLQHERLELVFKVSETEKMLTTVKSHKVAVVTKEREVAARETALAERESRLASIVSEKDHEIVRLRELLGQAEAHSEQRLRDVRKRMEEVMALREEELEQHVRQRDQELFAWWTAREQEIRAGMMKELEDKVNWVRGREEELKAEQGKLDEARKDLEVKLKAVEEKAASEAKGRKDKTPLEEVKNLLAPLAQMAQDSRLRSAQRRSQDYSFMNTTDTLETPVSRAVKPVVPFSAMKGVILTDTGEPIATPTPAQFTKLFVKSPKVNIEFAKIFDFDEGGETDAEDGEGDADLPPSPSKRERTSPEMTASASSARDPNAVPPTRLRKPSIRGSVRRAPLRRTATLPASASDPTGFASSSRPSKSTTSRTQSTDACMTTKTAPPAPVEYDLSDEENLPSPFLKRIERAIVPATFRSTKRSSTGNLLRVVAAANNAKQGKQARTAGMMGHDTRPSLAGARKASEDARKVLSRS